MINRKAVIMALSVLAPGAAQAAAQPPDLLEGWNELWRELMIDITVIGLLFAAVTVYLLIRYRRRRSDEEGSGKELKPLAAFGWVMIPAFLFMADDIFLAAKNFELWNQMRTVPKDAYEISVEGYMWGWDVTYPEGVQTNNEMFVPAGRPIKVKIHSRDVVHSFFIPDFRVKWDAVPGMETYIWFYPKEPGEHVMTCAEYCGMLHSGMHGKVKVVPAEEFQEWLKKQSDNKA